MVARFVGQVAISRPEHQHYEDCEVVIFGVKHVHPRSSLH
jgi:hypothetical protein